MDKNTLREIFFTRDEVELSRKDRFFSRELTGSVTQRLKRMLSSAPFRFARAVSHTIAHISTRVYGTALLSFGILGLIIYFVGLCPDTGIANPIVGVVFSLISIPFLLTDKPLPILLQDFKPTDYLFFEFFCMKRHSVSEGQTKFPLSVAIIIGCIPAMLSTVMPLWQVALIICTVVCVYMGIESPEFIFFATLFMLPYVRFHSFGDLVLTAAIILAAVSFVTKVVSGRRVMHIELYDICIGAMLLFILISGIFVKGMESFSGSVRLIVLAIGYFLAGNIITNRRLAEVSVSSIIASGSIASLISIGQFIGVVISCGLPTIEEVSVILARTDGLAVLLMASVIFAFGIARQRGRRDRWIYAVACIVCLIALILSGEFFALTSILVGILAYAVIKTNKLPALFLPLLLGLSVALLLLPYDVLDFIFNYSPSVVSSSELFRLWDESMSAFSDNILVGIGIGKESFAAEMASYGIFGYNDCSNLFIELGLEAGMFALIAFLVLLFTRLYHRSLQYLYVRNSQIEKMSNLSGVCMFALIAFSMVNYIWSDSSAYYLFWCIFGIGSATLRVAKKDYDDKVVYYEETCDFDSSVIDVEIG